MMPKILFLSDVLEGWKIARTLSDLTVDLDVRIDGHSVGTVSVAPLDEEDSPLFVQSLVPVTFWHGIPFSLQLSNVSTKEVILEGEFTIPNAIIDADAGLYGMSEVDSGGEITGWVVQETDTSPEVVALLVDGVEVARTLADRETDPRVGAGYRFGVPAEFFDGAMHNVRVLVDPDGAARDLLAVDHMLAPEQLPAIAANVELQRTGELSGELQTGALKGWDEAKHHAHLFLAIGEQEFGTAQVQEGGRFSFDLTGFSLSELLASDVVIYESIFGRPLAEVPKDLFLQSVHVEVLRINDKTVCLRLLSALTLHDEIRATLLVQGQEQELVFVLDTSEKFHICECQLSQAAEADAQIYIGTPGRFLSLAIRSDGNENMPRYGLGKHLPPSSSAIPSAISYALGSNVAPVVSLLYPDYAGQWSIDANGVLRGWMIDLALPSRLFHVQIQAGGKVLAELTTGQLAPLSGTDLPNVWPFGFEVQLPELADMASITVHVPDARADLPRAAQDISDQDPKKGLFLAEAVGGLPALDIDDPLRIAMLTSVPPEAAACLDLAFTAKHDSQDEKTTERLGATLRRRMRALFAEPEQWLGLGQPDYPMPHHRLQQPLLGVDIQPLLDLFPDTLALYRDMQTVKNWRDLLRILLDPNVIQHLLDPDDPHDRVCLDICKSIHAEQIVSEYPCERVDWTEDSPEGVQLSERLAQSRKLVVCDSTGRVLLRTNITKTKTVLKALNEVVDTPELMQPDAQIFLASQEGGVWRFSLLGMTLQSVAEDVAVDPDVTVSELQVGTSYIRLTCLAKQPPELFRVMIEGRAFNLRPYPSIGDVEPEAEQDAQLVYLVPLATAVEAETLDLSAQDFATDDAKEHGAVYDIRIEGETGKRPAGLPATIAVDQNHYITVVDARLESGALCGVLLSTAPEPVRLLLSEHVALTPEELEVAEEGTDPLRQVPLGRLRIAPPKLALVKKFRIPLTPAVLDGTRHDLTLTIAETLHWQAHLVAEPAFVAAQFATLTRHSEHVDFLVRLAKAGRTELLEESLLSVETGNAEPFGPEESFEILLTARTSIRPQLLPASLELLLERLWEFALHTDKRFNAFLKIAAQIVTEAEQDVPLRRFPQTQVGDLLADMAIVSQAANAEEAIRLIKMALSARRFPVVGALCEDALKAFGEDHRVQEVVGAVELQYGRSQVAEQYARKALALKAKSGPARLLLARALVHQGKTLEGVTTVTEGRGLSAWLGTTPNYESVKLAAQLDWAGAYATVGQDEAREAMIKQTDLCDTATGPRETPADVTYSLFFLQQPKQDLDALFMTLRQSGQCTQVAVPEVLSLAEIECTGRWAVVFAKPPNVTPELLETIFLQKRPAEGVVRIMSCRVDKQGIPGEPEQIGALIRADLLRIFGPVSFAKFFEQATGTLRMKTVLI